MIDVKAKCLLDYSCFAGEVKKRIKEGLQNTRPLQLQDTFVINKFFCTGCMISLSTYVEEKQTDAHAFLYKCKE